MNRPLRQGELEDMFAATDEAAANARWAELEGQDAKPERIRYIGPAFGGDGSPAAVNADDHPLELLARDQGFAYVRDRRRRELTIEADQLALDRRGA